MRNGISIRAGLAGLLAVGTLTLFACEKPATSATSGNPQATPAPTEKPAVYIVRGQVDDLPDPARPGSTFDVHHEAIDSFIGKDGSLGMNAMTMPFPLAPGVKLDGIAIGDFIEVTFEVRWKPKALYQVTKIVKLPADTKLEFRAAKRPDASPPASQ